MQLFSAVKKRASKVAHNRPRPFYFTVQPRPTAHSPELIFHILKSRDQTSVLLSVDSSPSPFWVDHQNHNCLKIRISNEFYCICFFSARILMRSRQLFLLIINITILRHRKLLFRSKFLKNRISKEFYSHLLFFRKSSYEISCWLMSFFPVTSIIYFFRKNFVSILWSSSFSARIL